MVLRDQFLLWNKTMLLEMWNLMKYQNEKVYYILKKYNILNTDVIAITWDEKCFVINHVIAVLI